MKISESEWRDFEKMIFRLLLDQYGIDESQVNVLTQTKKDGGYDGIFYIPYPANGGSFENDYLCTLFEAKLRSNIHHDLPLQDFSKALIISINKNADRLIIATNLYFSQRTIDILADYSRHTGLEIRFLTSYDIYEWLKSGGKEKIKPLLDSTELLDFLNSCYVENHERAQISSQQSIYYPKLDICPTRVIGSDREKAVSEIIELVQKKTGIVTIEGEAGIGKSVLTDQILFELNASDYYNIQKIDIEYYSTPRLLFLKLLDHVWHIPFNFLNNLEKDTVEDMVRWIGDQELPEEMRQVLMSVFHKTDDEYHYCFDLFNYYLVEYIGQVYGATKKRKTLLLSFTNVNYADENLLRFLMSFLKKAGNDLCILLELRTSLYINGKVHEKVWREFLKDIYQLPNLRRRVFVNEWNPNEISQFIRKYMQPIQLPVGCIQAIQRRVGKNPLNLGSFLSYIRLKLENDSVSESYLEEFVTNCPIENINSITSLLIERLVASVPLTSEILFLLGVLGGHASESFISRCIESPVEETLDQLITRTPLLWRGQSEIFVSHSLYLSVIQSYNYISVFRRQKIAQRILEHLDILELDAFHRGSIQVELCQILKIYSCAAKNAFDLAQKLFFDGQFMASYRYFVATQKCVEQIAAGMDDTLVQSMIGQIYCKFQLEDFTEEGMTQDLDDCQEVLIHSSLPEDLVQKHLTELLIAKNKSFHYFGKFQESMDTVKRILLSLYNSKCSDFELIGAMWAEYAIAVKETSSLSKSLNVFQKAIRVCPKSKKLQFAWLTHLSEWFSPFDPATSQNYLTQILDIESFLNLTDRIHNRVNIATMKFYCGKCKDALAEGTDLIRETYILGMRNEEGRLSNLLGCISFQAKEYEKACRHFKHGIDIFHGKSYVAFLWPLFANLSTLYLRCGMYQESFNMIQKCVRIFSDSYVSRIRQSTQAEGTYIKLHIALISMVGTLRELPLPEYQIDKLLSEIYQIAEGSVVADALQAIHSRKDAIDMSLGSAFCIDCEIYIKN